MGDELTKEDIDKLSQGKDISEITITLTYRNYRGEIAERHIIPISLYFGSNEFHDGGREQWLIKCWDVDKGAERHYAYKDVVSDKNEFMKELVKVVNSFNFG